jgi:hypothetical protein
MDTLEMTEKKDFESSNTVLGAITGRELGWKKRGQVHFLASEK